MLYCVSDGNKKYSYYLLYSYIDDRGLLLVELLVIDPPLLTVSDIAVAFNIVTSIERSVWQTKAGSCSVSIISHELLIDEKSIEAPCPWQHFQLSTDIATTDSTLVLYCSALLKSSEPLVNVAVVLIVDCFIYIFKRSV